MTPAASTSDPAQPATPSDLLHAVRDQRTTARAAEVAVLELAVEWAHANPMLEEATGRPVARPRVDDHALAAHYAGCDPEADPIDAPGWAGLPLIAWDADAGFACAALMSTVAARTLIRDALILAHRLPRVWARVRAGQVEVWRARQMATAVAGAPDDVCAAVDQLAEPRADRIGAIAWAHLIDEAMIRLYPDQVEAASLERLDRMHVTLHEGSIGHTGLADLDAHAEYADLRDLDTLLSALAARIHEYDPHIDPRDPLDYRRARALGLLSRPDVVARLLADDQGHDQGDGEGEESTGDAEGSCDLPSHGPRTMLVIHLTAETLNGTDPVAAVSNGLGGTRRPLFADAVATWCGRPQTDLTVLPVLDLGENITTDAYRPTTRLRRQIKLRDLTCRFPFCTRPAEHCDLDHAQPFDRGGPTNSLNLGPLCRHHHRLKTHAGYRIRWITPHGYEFDVDTVGTLPIAG